MNSKLPRYRLKGRNIEWGGNADVLEEKENLPLAKQSIPEASYELVRRAIDYLYLPHIEEQLSRIGMYNLGPWQRTCAWARRKSYSNECFVHSPRALVPFIDEVGSLDEAAHQIVTFGKEAKRAEDEIRDLGPFAGSDPSELGLTTLLGQIAALSLYERSVWAANRRPDIFEQALTSPEMSYYLAAAISPTTTEWCRLADSIARCPRFAFATLQLTHLPDTAFVLSARICLNEAASKNALFCWALKFSASCDNGRQFGQNVIANPEPGVTECALALILAPQNPRVPEWFSGLDKQPQLAYEVQRLLTLSNQLDAEFLFGPKLGPIAMADPRWAFHWVRDNSNGDDGAAFSLLPNLEWIAELIELKKCPVECADKIDDLAGKTMEMDHWLRCAFVLYAANKVTSNEK